MARPTMGITSSGTSRVGAAIAVILGLLALATAPAAWAHQDRPGCSSTGVSLMVETFRADRTTPLPVSQTATECETISYRVVLAKPPQDSVCAFEQGTLSLMTPDGVVHDLTPRGGGGESLIPCLGGSVDDPALTPPAGQCDPSVTEFVSGFIDYTITAADAAGGLAVALALYDDGLLHINTNNLPDAANGSTPIPTRIMLCPPDVECIDNFCDPQASDGVRMGLCVSQNLADSTPCTDNDGNPCTMAGCEMGVCVQTHMSMDCNGPCLSGLCDPATGACLPVPDSSLCPDTDGNSCTTAGCEAGVCVQTHILAENSTPCMDTDGNVCTTAGCEAGTCVQRHVLAPDSSVCPDTDGNGCTVAGCESGNCIQTHVTAPDSTVCPDTDGNTCTTAGCEAGMCIQTHITVDCSGDCESGICDPVQGCIPLPDSTPCSDLDGTACTLAGCEVGVCVQDHLVASEGTMPGCGALPTAPCSVTIAGRPGSFTSVQAAVDAAANGSTINVTGLCDGTVLIDNRDGLLIQGPAPAGAICPAAEMLPDTLQAAVRSNAATSVFKIRDSRNVVVRFLKIVDGPTGCMKFTRAATSTLNCSCVAGCGEAGVEVADTRTSDVSQSLIRSNGDDGVVVLGTSTANTISNNTIEFNGDDGIDLEGTGNDFLNNVVRGNGADGIDLDDADENRLIGNAVVSNGCIPTASTDSGIEVRNSDRNEIDENVIEGNADGLVNVIHCRSGSSGNFGSNVPPGSPCR